MTKRMTAKKLYKVIKDKCLECCAGDRKSWKECNIELCPLWNYRLG